MAKRKSRAKKFTTCDCETDPFLYGRIPAPFLWGFYDGLDFFHFNSTEEFIEHIRDLEIIVFAHNGGKFDFHFLLDWIEEGEPVIINGRLVELKIGKATLRDSFSIMPVPLAAYEKTKIDYSKLEADVRHKHMAEIISYLRDDCLYLYDMVRSYFEEAGRKITLAGNALAKGKALGCDPGKTDKNFDNKFRDFYFGGRCQAFKAGHFKNVNIYDIKSAYPYAMTFDHPTGSDLRITQKLLPRERGQGAFWHIRCNSFGAFPRRNKQGLFFPNERGEFFVTGWELYAALEHSFIEDLEIIKGYEFYRSINFCPFVDHWFKHKEEAEKRGDKVNRLIAKLMLNSLYGKLCQNPENFKDYVILPKGSFIEPNWQLEAELARCEIHSIKKEITLREKFGDRYNFLPQFLNVATGSSITGFVRAMLLDTIAEAGKDNVLYCDTDSVFLHNKKVSEKDGLGGWQLESRATDLWIAGKKLYAAKLKGGGEKIASKGVKLNIEEIVKITEGEIIEYFSQAPSFSLTEKPRFIKRKVRATHGLR